MRRAVITTVAGSGPARFFEDSFAGDGGPADAALLFLPFGIARDAAGNLYIADTANRRVRRVDAESGLIATVAGAGEVGFVGDLGPATVARLAQPEAVALDAAGNLYIADRSNDRVRSVDAASGVITTVAGTGEAGSSGRQTSSVRSGWPRFGPSGR